MENQEHDLHETEDGQTAVEPEDRQSEEQQDDSQATAEQRRSVFDAFTLQTYVWRPDGDIKAMMYICHGVHEYMGRYEKLANHLKDNGILVFALDHVGHGRSEGLRGHVDSVRSYATDALSYMEDMKSKYPSLPLFLMGHSMGGLVAVIIALQQQDIFTGLLLSAPYLEIDSSPVEKVFAKVFRHVIPKLCVKHLDYHLISSIPEEAEEYNNDPLNIHMAVRLGLGASMIEGVTEYRPRFHELVLPLFVMHGTADRLVPITASETVYRDAAGTDKTLEIFQDSFHEILHDRDQERARELICNWVLARLNST